MNSNQENETLYAMALTRISHFNPTGLLQLYRRMGSATAIVEHRKHIDEVIPDASAKLKEGLKDLEPALKRAEQELAYDQRYGIRPLTMADPDYPQRLRECNDAPLVLYYKGSANLNATHVINIIGTRHCTIYGQELIRQFVSQLSEMVPNTLIVSGLAYGVDIHAHRNALQYGYETVGVLAHGLDEIYPPRHRDTAVKMLKQGGLLTEYMASTNADKLNFVRRNRIVAGMSDACILVESADHGGGLITARLSRDYNRDVFAFPGRIGDPYSEGCNNLIRDNGATLITCAADFVRAMGWEKDLQLFKAQQAGIERQLFPDLTPDEQVVVDALRQQNDQQLNMLSAAVHIPVFELSTTLFQLEMKGIIRTMAGGTYHLLGLN
jgi:DNA processing protein